MFCFVFPGPKHLKTKLSKSTTKSTTGPIKLGADNVERTRQTSEPMNLAAGQMKGYFNFREHFVGGATFILRLKWPSTMGKKGRCSVGGSTDMQTEHTEIFITLGVVDRVMAPQRCPGPNPSNL